MVDETTRAEVRQALLDYLDTDTIWWVLICMTWRCANAVLAVSIKTILRNWSTCKLNIGTPCYHGLDLRLVLSCTRLTRCYSTRSQMKRNLKWTKFYRPLTTGRWQVR